MDRRDWMAAVSGAAVLSAAAADPAVPADRRPTPRRGASLKISRIKITPIALPDPPLLAASGCHGPYFLRNIIEIETADGIRGVGETRGGLTRTTALERARQHVVGHSALSYRSLWTSLRSLGNDVYAGIELACLDAIGRAVGLRVCELLGGPTQESVEFASYLFFRFAADHPQLINDTRIVDKRGRGDRALDAWGEVRTPETMAELAGNFHKKWGFTCHKLKAGVLPPDLELAALQAINDRFQGKHRLRIDPNGRWTPATAKRIAKHLQELPLEYYEDPVLGQQAMSEIRAATGLTMSTNMCVTRFEHIPQAVKTQPVDVVLCDHHGWGGISGCQALGKLAPSLGWKLSQHSNNHAGITMAGMVHVGAVVPELTLASDTHYPWLIEGADVIQGSNLPIRDGRIAVPTQPGLGVELDQDQLARAHEVYRKCGMRDRDDAGTMRRVQPNWSRSLF